MQGILSAYADKDKAETVRSLKKLGGIRDLGSRDDMFETPPGLYREICKNFNLPTVDGLCELDACASEDNFKCSAYIDEGKNALRAIWRLGIKKTTHVWCNPPRSKNGKFVRKMYKEWDRGGIGIVAMLCWNDLGAKYGQEMFEQIRAQNVGIMNLGKVSFLKDGKPTPYASRLSYFAVYMPPMEIGEDGTKFIDDYVIESDLGQEVPLEDLVENLGKRA